MNNLVLRRDLGFHRRILSDDLLSKIFNLIQLGMMSLEFIYEGFLEVSAKKADELRLFGPRALGPVMSQAAAGDRCPIHPAVEFLSNQLPPLGVALAFESRIRHQGEDLVGGGTDLGGWFISAGAQVDAHRH